jgi:NAD-dependent deacetylase
MKIVVMSGAGISAESGLQTFRDSDGLWEGYNIHDVATPEAWTRDPVLVQSFYNIRRKAVLEAVPNAAHRALALLESYAEVQIITQNIDDLHERAGSTQVLHLHGLITQARSSVNENLLYNIDGWELRMGDRCELGSQLRPHVVWFGEAVPMMEPALREIQQADLVLVVGTSMQVYPAASLVHYKPSGCPVYVIDPRLDPVKGTEWHYRRETAGTGVPAWVEEVMNNRLN